MNIMKLFEHIIDWLAQYFISPISEEQLIALDNLNPSSFTAKEIAKIMNWSIRTAKFTCNSGVRQGKFVKINEDHYSTVSEANNDN